MWIYKCDHCKKVIHKEDKLASVTAGFGFGITGTYQFCKKCGEPIAKILKSYKLKK
ncbi:MAG TPA: hypothetical protein VJ043_00375 [Candidatus Paceibacterota bacterium]|nr:hypothetical protein [Candidatus Paceibacterota bacterium]